MDQRTLRPPGGDMEGGFSEAFRQTLEGTPIGVALLDPPDTIRYANPALYELAPDARPATGFQDLLAPWARRRLADEARPAACRTGHWHGEVALEGDAYSLCRLHLIAAWSPQGPNDTPWIAMIHGSEEKPANPDIPTAPRRLSIPMQEETRLLDPEEIHLLEADRHYTHIHASNGSLLASQPLATFQRQLADQPFIRTHRSFLVNLHQVRSLRRDGGSCYLYLDGLPDRPIPVSRRRLARVEELLGLRPATALA